jgi:hypothetical protein
VGALERARLPLLDGVVSMRALSLWQPWATLVAVAGKHETRSWETKYRGDLLICSTQSSPAKAFHEALRDPKRKLWERISDGNPISKGLYQALAHGVALCVVELVGCSPASEWKLAQAGAGMADEVEAQSAMGDLSDGRFVWIFRNRRVLRKPIAAKGRQGLWTPSPELVAQVAEELARA